MKRVISMATSRISINIDEDVKRNAQQILSEMGLDMTTAINSFLRSLVREKRFPCEIHMEPIFCEAACNEYISKELDKSLQEAMDPNTKWLSHEEIVARIDCRNKIRNNV